MFSETSTQFLFTYVLGNRMLDRCIALFNCGTLFPMWTEDAMPSKVAQKHNITAYITRVYDCRFEGRKLEVMRCSWNTY